MDAKDLVPVFSAAVGAIAGLGGAIVNAIVTSKRETRARREERLAAKEDRRDQYQRETLLALQEALAALMRATAKAHIHDKLAYRETKAWHKTLLPDDLSEEVRETQSRTALLTERVLNDRVRNGVYETAGLTVAIFAAIEPETAEDFFRKAGQSYVATQRVIGTALRATHAP